MSTLGERIKTARGHLSQDVFSSRIGVNKGSLGFYERNENQPKADVLLKICSETGISVEWLMTGSGPMRPGEQSASPSEAHPSLDSCAKCAALEAENKLLQEFKILQDETIKAQAETITLYKRALETAQQELFKGDHGLAVVPPSARSARNNTEINK